MLGFLKYRIGGSAVDKFQIKWDGKYYDISRCSNNCNETELVVLPKDFLSASVGCSFCGRIEEAQDILEAIEKWNQKQDSGTSSSD